MFRSLFGRPNPTRTWPPHTGQLLTCDLDAGSLNGGALGQRLDCVSFLGPDEDRQSSRTGEFYCHYYSLGLCVECHGPEYVLTGYEIVFRDPEEQKYQPFQGRIIRNGDTLELAATTLDTCADVLGEYFWLDHDDDESIIFYEFTGREWQLVFDKASLLKRLIVTSQPLLADEEQREAYNVTRSWPPGS